MSAELPAPTQAQMPFGLLDRQEAARFLRVSTRTLDRLVSDRDSRIPVVRLYGCMAFVPQDLMSWASKVSQSGGVK